VPFFLKQESFLICQVFKYNLPSMSLTRRTFLKTAGSFVAVGAAGSTVAPTPAPDRATADLCFASAHVLAQMLRNGQVSAREVMTAHLRQIARLNPKINAIVAKLDDPQCLALADAADQWRARGKPLGPLYGLPFA